MRDLEKYIIDNREELSSENNPLKGHRERFELKLARARREQVARSRRVWFISGAASVAALVAVLLTLPQSNTADLSAQDSTQSLIEMERELDKRLNITKQELIELLENHPAETQRAIMRGIEGFERAKEHMPAGDEEVYLVHKIKLQERQEKIFNRLKDKVQ